VRQQELLNRAGACVLTSLVKLRAPVATPVVPQFAHCDSYSRTYTVNGVGRISAAILGDDVSFMNRWP
jgi:hypothetical protein